MITTFPKTYIYAQGLVLLLLIGVTYFLTKIKSPFLIPSINNLENQSNFSALTIILVGNLLLFDINDIFKEFLAIVMILSSLIFMILWVSSTFDIVLDQNSETLKNKCLRFYVLYKTTHKIAKKIAKINKNNEKKSLIIKEFMQMYHSEKERTLQEISDSKINRIPDEKKKNKSSRGKIFKKAMKFFNDI